jgi:hypothetical protein
MESEKDGITGREDDKLGGQQVQTHEILGSQQTVLGFFGRVSHPELGVGTGQRQTRAKHGVLHLRPREARHAFRSANDLTEVETKAKAFAVGVLSLVEQEEAMRGEVKDSGRPASSLEPALQSRGVEPGGHTEACGDSLALGPCPREAVEVVGV